MDLSLFSISSVDAREGRKAAWDLIGLAILPARLCAPIRFALSCLPSLSLSGVHIVRYAPSATHCSRSGRYPGVSTLVILFSPWPHPAAQAAVKAQASLANCPDQRARSVGNGSFDVSQATDNIETEHWCPGQACYCCCCCRTADADSRPRSSLRRQAAASVRHMR